MSTLVGYQLKDSNDAVIKTYGGVWGESVSIPDALFLPDMQIFCPEINVNYGGYTLVEMYMDEPVDTTQPTPNLFGIAKLVLTNGDLSGIDTAAGVGFAFMADTGVMWVYLSQSEPNYVAFVKANGLNADVTEQYDDYFVVTTTNNGTPTDPTIVNIQLIKV